MAIVAKHETEEVLNESGRPKNGVKRATREEYMSRMKERTAVDGDGCWMWTGPGRPKGRRGGRSRGQIKVFGKTLSIGQAAFLLWHGDIPDGVFVLHRCNKGEEGCCNPGHLYLGNHAQNMRDMVAAGNSRPGESHPMAKLTEEVVRWIRAEAAKGRSAADIAREISMDRTGIWQIIKRKTWRHLP